MIGITLIAGAAVLGWVNGQAKTSESAYGSSVATDVNYLKEHFVLVGVQAPSGSPACPSGTCTLTGGAFTAYVYNDGNIALNVNEITVTSLSTTNAVGSAVTYLNLQAFANGTVRAFSAAGDLYADLITKCEPSGAGWSCTSGCTLASSSNAFTSTTIAENAVPPTTFSVTMPVCGSSIQVSDGASYLVTAIGYYGNVVDSPVQTSW